MAGAKEIRTKIRSVQSTQKITKAMEMVAASKMRKALERMQAARPYASRIRNVISHLAHAHTEYRSPGLVEREIKRVGLIVISTDRGLCGGLNTNLFKAAIVSMQQWRERGVEIDLSAVLRLIFARSGPRHSSSSAGCGAMLSLMSPIWAMPLALRMC